MSTSTDAASKVLCQTIACGAPLRELRRAHDQWLAGFVARVRSGSASWQELRDVALNRGEPAAARILSLLGLAATYPDRTGLVLLHVLTDRSEPRPVRVAALMALGNLDSPTASHVLIRALDSPVLDETIFANGPMRVRFEASGIPNDFRLALISLLVDTSAGRRVLTTIWRDPERHQSAWFAAGFWLWENNQNDDMLLEAANIAERTAYAIAARVKAIRWLYTVRTETRTSRVFPLAVWVAIRKIWGRDSGDAKRYAGELLKLQG